MLSFFVLLLFSNSIYILINCYSAENLERSPDLHYLNCKNHIENIVKKTVEPVHLNKNIVAISFFYYQTLDAELIGMLIIKHNIVTFYRYY